LNIIYKAEYIFIAIKDVCDHNRSEFNLFSYHFEHKIGNENMK